jgi:hypothetical protein
VAALVAAGVAERDTVGRARRRGRTTGRHVRRSRDGDWLFTYRNPAGVLVRRVPTVEDREVRERVLASPEYAAFEVEFGRMLASFRRGGSLRPGDVTSDAADTASLEPGSPLDSDTVHRPSGGAVVPAPSTPGASSPGGG